MTLTSARTAVELGLRDVLDRLPEPGGDSCRRIVAGGGKRLRPELVFSAAEAMGAPVADPADGPRFDVLTAAAVAVELLHTATLLHDDLLDDSAMRRGVPAVHRSAGRTGAVITGDALIGHSWRLIAGTDVRSVADLAVALQDMCLGESDEERLRFDARAGVLAVLRVSQLKTGALLGAACRIGARIGGADEREVEAFGRFGNDFGVALQLVDDVLDVVSEEGVLGKPCAADFRSGTVTLPAVFALGVGDPTGGPTALSASERDELHSLLRPDLTDAEPERAHELLVRSGSPARTMALARAFARRAARTLSPRPAARALAALPVEYVERQITTKIAPRHRQVFESSYRAGDDSADNVLLLDEVG